MSGKALALAPLPQASVWYVQVLAFEVARLSHYDCAPLAWNQADNHINFKKILYESSQFYKLPKF